MYVTQNKQTLTYTGLSGLQEQVRQSGIERFQSDYPNEVIRETFTEGAYFNVHQCRDTTGCGCCEECGSVIPDSWLNREIQGGD